MPIGNNKYNFDGGKYFADWVYNEVNAYIGERNTDINVYTTLDEHIQKAAEKILRECPKTHLYLQSVLPINESFKRYKRLNGKTSYFAAINSQLQAWVNKRNDPRLTFINLYPLFTEHEGSEVLQAELTTDGLHLREEGYRIWSKALKKALK